MAEIKTLIITSQQLMNAHIENLRLRENIKALESTIERLALENEALRNTNEALYDLAIKRT